MEEDLFSGFARNLWIVPEGNGKSSLGSIIVIYAADLSHEPWISVGAASAPPSLLQLSTSRRLALHKPDCRFGRRAEAFAVS
jgi:hypothetical protein